LFELLNMDGKDKIMPVLRQVDQRTQQIQALMAQAEQMTAENETLKKAIAQGGASMRKQPTQQHDLQGMTVPDASAAVGGVKQEQSA
jgi:regulator of replication initiation timing